MAGTPEQEWQSIATSQLAQPAVTSGTGFGRSEGLRVAGKIFAMLVHGDLVVKLPRQRVDELVASGLAERFDPGHGRRMKEWITVGPSASKRWSSLVTEARRFVATPVIPRRRSAAGSGRQDA
jgi:hypothetical protein